MKSDENEQKKPVTWLHWWSSTQVLQLSKTSAVMWRNKPFLYRHLASCDFIKASLTNCSAMESKRETRISDNNKDIQDNKKRHTRTHTHTYVCFCKLWGLSIYFYYFNTDQTIFLPPKPNSKPTLYKKKQFALLHFQINIIYYFLIIFYLVAGRSPQCHIFLILLSLWGHLVPTM